MAPGTGQLVRGTAACAPARAAELAQAESPPDARPASRAGHGTEAGAAPAGEAGPSYYERLAAAHWPLGAGAGLPAHSGSAAAGAGARPPPGANGRVAAAEPQVAWDPGPDPYADDRDVGGFAVGAALVQGSAADLEDSEYVLDQEACASQLESHAGAQRPAQGPGPAGLGEQALQGFGHAAGPAASVIGATSSGSGGARMPSEEAGDKADSAKLPESLTDGGGKFVFGGRRAAGAAVPPSRRGCSVSGSSGDSMDSLAGGDDMLVADSAGAGGAPPQPSRRSSGRASRGRGSANEALTVRDGMLVFGADEREGPAGASMQPDRRSSGQASSASSWHSSRRLSSSLPGPQAGARASASGPDEWHAGSSGADPHGEDEAHEGLLPAAGLSLPFQTLAASGRLSRSGHYVPQDAPSPAVEQAGHARSLDDVAAAAPDRGASARRVSDEAQLAGWADAADPGGYSSGAGYGQAGARSAQGGVGTNARLAARSTEGAGPGPRAGAELHRATSAGAGRARPHAAAAHARRSAVNPRTMPWVDPDPVALRQVLPGSTAGLARGGAPRQEAAHVQLPVSEDIWWVAQQAERQQPQPGSSLDFSQAHVSAFNAPGAQRAEHTFSAAPTARSAPHNADRIPGGGRALGHSASLRLPRPQSAAPGKRRATAAPLSGPWEAPARAAPAPASAQAPTTPGEPWPAMPEPEADQAQSSWWESTQAAAHGQDMTQSATSADSQDQTSAKAPPHRALVHSVSARQSRPLSAAPGKRRATAAPQSTPWQGPSSPAPAPAGDQTPAGKQSADELAPERCSEVPQPGDEQANTWTSIEAERAAADAAVGFATDPDLFSETSDQRPGDEQAGTESAERSAAHLGSQGTAHAGPHVADEDAAVVQAGHASAAPQQHRARGRSELRASHAPLQPPDTRAAAPRARRASAFASSTWDRMPAGSRHVFQKVPRRPAPLITQRPVLDALAEGMQGEGAADLEGDSGHWARRSASEAGTHATEVAGAEGPAAGGGGDVSCWDDALRPWDADGGTGSDRSAAAPTAKSMHDREHVASLPQRQGSADGDWDGGSAPPDHPDPYSGHAAPANPAPRQPGSQGGRAGAGVVSASLASDSQGLSRPRVRSLAAMQSARPQSAGALHRRASAAPHSAAWHAPRQQPPAAPPQMVMEQLWDAQGAMAQEEAQGELAMGTVQAPGAGSAMRPRLASVGSTGSDTGFGSGPQATRPHTAAPGPAHRRFNPAHFPNLRLAADESHTGVSAIKPHAHAQDQQAGQMAQAGLVSAERLSLVHIQRPASPHLLAQRALGLGTPQQAPQGRAALRRPGCAPPQRQRGAQPVGGTLVYVTAAAARAERLACSVTAQVPHFFHLMQAPTFHVT